MEPKPKEYISAIFISLSAIWHDAIYSHDFFVFSLVMSTDFVTFQINETIMVAVFISRTTLAHVRVCVSARVSFSQILFNQFWCSREESDNGATTVEGVSPTLNSWNE